MTASFDEKRQVAEEQKLQAVNSRDTPQLNEKVESEQHLQSRHDNQHHDHPDTTANILAHPTGHDTPVRRSSMGFNTDPEKWQTTCPGSPNIDAVHSPAQSTRALTLRDDGDENFYPEGGREAWLVVFGSWCSLVSALGVMNTLASFQSYISRNQLSDYSEGQIGWIFSLYACLSFGLGVFIGPIFDKFGARILLITGSVGIVLAMMLMSICTSKFNCPCTLLDFKPVSWWPW